MSQFRSNIPSAESRKAPRQRVHHPAMVNRDDGTPLLNCMIWDVSALGAKLTVAADERIPISSCCCSIGAAAAAGAA